MSITISDQFLWVYFIIFSGLSVGAIVGIAIGIFAAIVLAVIITLIIVFLICCRGDDDDYKKSK